MITDFLAEYEKTEHKEKLRQTTFSYFNDKYFKTPFQEYWIIEQQERFLARKLRYFIPGRVYTYQYIPHGKDELSFYDKRPMVYVIGEYVSNSTGYNILQGINLNFLPETARVNFINTAYKLFGDAYEKADEMSDKQRITTMREIYKLVTNWYFMTLNFNKRSKIGLEFAIRNYDLGRMKQPVLIEVEDFPMIPFFTPKELVGKAPGYVYSLYVKSKMEILKNSEKKKLTMAKGLENQKKYKKPGA